MTIDRKEQRKLQQRQEILDAAEQVFAQQGYHPTTMDSVAEECGWSKGTLYLHFENKEDLFFSILISKIETLSALVISELENTSSLEAILETLIHVQFDFFQQHKSFMQLAISEQGKAMQSSSTGKRERMVANQIDYINQITAQVSSHLQDDSPVSPITFTRAVSGAIHIHMMAWLMHPDSVNLDELKAEIKELYLNGILPYKKH